MRVPTEDLEHFELYGLDQTHLQALIRGALNQDDMRPWIEERRELEMERERAQTQQASRIKL